jgi:GNAT superfamily N-acetyltransferase
MITVEKMQSDSQISSTFPVMSQLRTHLIKEQYVERIRRQQQTNNYNVAALTEDGIVKCVAGYRITEHLAWGKILYVDDLVTDESARSSSYGKQIMDWLVEQARINNCEQFHLDSGVQKHAAHRFYLRERMDITCHHFAMLIK